MTSKNLFNSSIHLRFLAVALLPLLFVTFALTLYTIEARKTDLTNSLNTAGEMASNHLATVSDFSLYSRNIPLLSTTAHTVVRLPEVKGVAYLDKDNVVIFRSGDFPNIFPSATDKKFIVDSEEQGFLLFRKPIYLMGVEFTDYQEENQEPFPDAELIGWVIVVIDQSSLLEKQKEIITTSIWLSIFGFAIATILTYMLSLMLIAPIQQLTMAIKKMAGGDLNTRAKSGTTDELAILASGINRLAESVTEGKVHLEDRIRVATQQLQETLADLKKKNQELETAREDAETADQAKSDFLARMSHELRTPITSIQGFVRLLEASNLHENDRNYCQIIDQAALHLLTLIDDILAFSKLQSDTVELNNQPIDLAECTEQVVALFAPQAQRKGLELMIDYAPELSLHRIGDSIRIQQIFSNLIANAIKFCNEGGVYIFLKTNDNQDVIFEVQDTGIGIHKEAQDQLFNAFAQADTSISRLYGGTGLGLSIVKNLVDLMSGQIDLSSSHGKGSCFKITLPLPLNETQPNWQIEPIKVVVSSCHDTVKSAVVHSVQRFGIDNITCVESDQLINVVSSLNQDDRVILCPPTHLPKDQNVTEFMLCIRAATPAKLILMSAQFNFYQQFNAKQRAELQPISFLASPPPISELHRALSKQVADKSHTLNVMAGTQLLDGVNILIAEDNQFTRLLLDTLLSKLGAYCTLTSNGNEALAACQLDQFDLFLVDIHMPMKNGIETIQALRDSHNLNAKVPILAVTADILQQEEQALFEAGSNGLLIKPLDEQELIKKICEQLNIVLPQEPLIENSASNDISIEVFQQEMRALLNSAKSSFEAGDTPELREQIHQLLGIAGVYQLEAVELLVRTLHKQVKTDQLEGVAELIGEIETEIKATSF